MKKKILSLTLAVVLITALLPGAVSATTDIKTLAQEITAGITSDYEKARAIHFWVSSNIEYDGDVYTKDMNGEPRSEADSQTAENVLQKRRAVCAGYANLTVAFLTAVDIPARVAAYGAGANGHAWTEAYVADRWIIMDTTGDNPDASTYGVFFDVSASVYYPFIREGAHFSSMSDWAIEGVQQAYAKGFIIPLMADMNYHYTNEIKRQEFCRMAVKWVEYATGKDIDTILSERGLTRDPNAFTDTSDPDILAAFALGITSGTGNNRFAPYGLITREAAAGMIKNVCAALGRDVSGSPKAGFSDAADISVYTVDGVNYCVANGIMSGSDNKFSPRVNFSREMSIVTFNNMR